MAEPFVEAIILAGLTRELAMNNYLDGPEGIEIDVEGCPRVYRFSNIRIAPPLQVARRYRAIATWVPVRDGLHGGDDDETTV